MKRYIVLVVANSDRPDHRRVSTHVFLSLAAAQQATKMLDSYPFIDARLILDEALQE